MCVQTTIDFDGPRPFCGRDIAQALRAAAYPRWEHARPGARPADGWAYWNAYWGGHAISQERDDVRFIVIKDDGTRHVVRQLHANGDVPAADFWRAVDGWLVDEQLVSSLTECLEALGVARQ
jgi:hypothetical protein